MKDFEYYKNVGVELLREKGLLADAIALLDNVPMTKAEREKAENQAKEEVKEIYKKNRAEYSKAEQSLTDEFWKDCRKELNYGSYLTDKGCSLLESKAWEDGHAYGFSEVYNHLVDLDELIYTIKDEIK